MTDKQRTNVDEFFAELDRRADHVGPPVDERVGGIAAGLGRKQLYEKRLRALQQQPQTDDQAL